MNSHRDHNGRVGKECQITVLSCLIIFISRNHWFQSPLVLGILVLLFNIMKGDWVLGHWYYGLRPGSQEAIDRKAKTETTELVGSPWSCHDQALMFTPCWVFCRCLGFSAEQGRTKLLMFSPCLKAASNGPTVWDYTLRRELSSVDTHWEKGFSTPFQWVFKRDYL